MKRKYIDAEKLIAEIERRREICADISADERNEEVAEYYRGKEVAHDEISSLITSLQEEQTEMDLDKAARNVFESWMGGTMEEVRRDMVELGKVLIARKEIG